MIRMQSQFPYMADYLDIMPRPPLGEQEVKVMESLRDLAMKHEITFVTPFSGGTNIGELLPLFGAGGRQGLSNVMTFEFLKARNSGKPVVYVDWEASFDPDQLGFIVGSEKL